MSLLGFLSFLSLLSLIKVKLNKPYRLNKHDKSLWPIHLAQLNKKKFGRINQKFETAEA
jgi:hypothetical protein